MGTGVLWAVLVGALLKFTLNEGLARWQLATGQTFIEGVAQRGGRIVGILFLPYLLLWSFFVGSSLISASGVTLYAMAPFFEAPEVGKAVYGILCSILGLCLVHAGGFRVFQWVMNACVALMFLVVLITTARLWPGWEAVLTGLFLPSLEGLTGTDLTWTVALIGGIGGTVTILCHGYWLKEEELDTIEDLPLCRLDLILGYGVTAFFGIAMVIISSNLTLSGGGANLLIELADKLRSQLGPVGAWAFLIGAFGTIFSSLLGVWQSVPYLFADIWRLFFKDPEGAGGENPTKKLSDTPVYKITLWALATVPALGLFMRFEEIQKLYAIIGVAFMPLLCLGLMIMNGRKEWVGEATNRLPSILALTITLTFFAWLAWRKLMG